MFYKNYLILLGIIILIFLSLSCVSADNNITSVETEFYSINGDVSNITVYCNNNISLNAEYGNFHELNSSIYNVNSSYIVLDKDYCFSNENDFKEGIIISQDNLIIDGCGHTISGECQARAFIILGNNVTILNLNFINCYVFAADGGAINWLGSKGKLFNCSFSGNKAKYGPKFSEGINNCFTGGLGGAVNLAGINNTINSCSFFNNSASIGGALAVSGKYCTVYNSIFVANQAILGSFDSRVGYYSPRVNSGYGGAIYWTGDDGNLLASALVSNIAKSAGGLFSEKSSNLDVNYNIIASNNASCQVLFKEVSIDLNDNYFMVQNSSDFEKYGLIYNDDEIFTPESFVYLDTILTRTDGVFDSFQASFISSNNSGIFYLPSCSLMFNFSNVIIPVHLVDNYYYCDGSLLSNLYFDYGFSSVFLRNVEKLNSNYFKFFDGESYKIVNKINITCKQDFYNVLNLLLKGNVNYDILFLNFIRNLTLILDKNYLNYLDFRVGTLFINGNGSTIKIKNPDITDNIHFLSVGPYAQVYISNLTLMGFNSAIMNHGNLHLKNLNFINNKCKIAILDEIWNFFPLGTSYAVDCGGAINNFAYLECENCVFADNFAEDFGGAIYSSGELSIVTLINTVFKNNTFDKGLNNIYACDDSVVRCYNCTLSKDTCKGNVFFKDFVVENGTIHSVNKTFYINSTESLLVACKLISQGKYDNVVLNFESNINIEIDRKAGTVLNTKAGTFFSTVFKFYADFFRPANMVLSSVLDYSGKGHSSSFVLSDVVDGVLIINGNGAHIHVKGEYDNVNYHFLNINPSASVLVNDLEVSCFNAPVINKGILKCNNVTFSDNKFVLPPVNKKYLIYFGGAITNYNSLNCVNCSFYSNWGPAAGAISSLESKSDCRIINSVFKDNLYFPDTRIGLSTDNPTDSKLYTDPVMAKIYINKFRGCINDVVSYDALIFSYNCTPVSKVVNYEKYEDENSLHFTGKGLIVNRTSLEPIKYSKIIDSVKDLMDVASYINDNVCVNDVIELNFTSKSFDIDLDQRDFNLLHIRYGTLIINGNGASVSVSNPSVSDEFHFLFIEPKVNVFINNLTIKGFNTAINNTGSLILNNCVFKENKVDYIKDHDFSGAIENYGYIYAMNCSFINNYAKFGSSIYNVNGAFSFLKDCIFFNNTAYASNGAEIYNFNGGCNGFLGFSNVNLTLFNVTMMKYVEASPFTNGWLDLAQYFGSLFLTTTVSAMCTVLFGPFGPAVGLGIGAAFYFGMDIVIDVYNHNQVSLLRSCWKTIEILPELSMFAAWGYGITKKHYLKTAILNGKVKIKDLSLEDQKLLDSDFILDRYKKGEMQLSDLKEENLKSTFLNKASEIHHQNSLGITVDYLKQVLKEGKLDDLLTLDSNRLREYSSKEDTLTYNELSSYCKNKKVRDLISTCLKDKTFKITDLSQNIKNKLGVDYFKEILKDIDEVSEFKVQESKDSPIIYLSKANNEIITNSITFNDKSIVIEKFKNGKSSDKITAELTNNQKVKIMENNKGSVELDKVDFFKKMISENRIKVEDFKYNQEFKNILNQIIMEELGKLPEAGINSMFDGEHPLNSIDSKFVEKFHEALEKYKYFIEKDFVNLEKCYLKELFFKSKISLDSFELNDAITNIEGVSCKKGLGLNNLKTETKIQFEKWFKEYCESISDKEPLDFIVDNLKDSKYLDSYVGDFESKLIKELNPNFNIKDYTTIENKKGFKKYINVKNGDKISITKDDFEETVIFSLDNSESNKVIRFHIDESPGYKVYIKEEDINVKDKHIYTKKTICDFSNSQVFICELDSKSLPSNDLEFINKFRELNYERIYNNYNKEFNRLFNHKEEALKDCITVYKISSSHSLMQEQGYYRFNSLNDYNNLIHLMNAADIRDVVTFFNNKLIDKGVLNKNQFDFGLDFQRPSFKVNGFLNNDYRNRPSTQLNMYNKYVDSEFELNHIKYKYNTNTKKFEKIKDPNIH